jgi:hypothetical protein
MSEPRYLKVGQEMSADDLARIFDVPVELINPQYEKPSIDELRGQWLLLAGRCSEALERWRMAWLAYVDEQFLTSEGRAAARERQAKAWTEYVAVSAQADLAWHDYDAAVDAR